MKKSVFAVTGGIGSGKSSALDIIQEAGYATFSCDDEVKNAYSNPDVLKKLERFFPSAFDKGRNPDKAEIARLCFSNDKLYSKLTEIVTMPVFNELLKTATKKATTDNSAVFMEVPLLFELNLQNRFDGVIVITRPLQSRIESVAARSNLSREQIIARINKQTDYDAADLSPYVVVVNDKDVTALKRATLAAVDALIGK